MNNVNINFLSQNDVKVMRKLKINIYQFQEGKKRKKEKDDPT